MLRAAPNKRITAGLAGGRHGPRRASRRAAYALIALATTLGTLSVGAASTAQASPSGSGDLPLLHAVADQAHGGRIVDADGRQVLLRGVNVNTLGDYWHPNNYPPTFPFGEHDAQAIHGIGWNVVRLVLSWSKVEPKPGQYDDAYLDHASHIVSTLAAHGIYTIVDMHQDAWSATLYATKKTHCTKDYPTPNLGWDGAPRWATLGQHELHCHLVAREYSPAVKTSWDDFFANKDGPGGVGIRTRFAHMWHHVAEHFATSTDVAAFDVLNEPGSLTQENNKGLNELYAEVVHSIRAGETDGGGPRHIVLLEPSVLFNAGGARTIKAPNDDDIAFGPHIYTGSVRGDNPPDKSMFDDARKLASSLGGVPVINGEWGGGTGSNKPVSAKFFHTYQALTDSYGYGATFWLYQQSCGDPHAIRSHEKYAAGLYVVPCDTNKVEGQRHKLVSLLSRPYPMAVAGQTKTFSFDPGTRRFQLSYAPAGGSSPTEIALPQRRYPDGYQVQVSGAHVASDPDAAILRLRSDSGATAVTLSVTPPGQGGTPSPTPTQHGQPGQPGNQPGSASQVTKVPSGYAATGAGGTAGIEDAGLLAGGLAALALAGAVLGRRRTTR